MIEKTYTDAHTQPADFMELLLKWLQVCVWLTVCVVHVSLPNMHPASDYLSDLLPLSQMI